MTLSPSHDHIVQATLQIHLLKARYWTTVDAQDWDALRELFTEDAVLDFPDAGMSMYTFDRFVERNKRRLTGGQTIHVGHTPLIEVDGTSASGSWGMQDIVIPPEGASWGATTGYGRYFDEYVAQDGIWRIKSTRLQRSVIFQLDMTHSRTFGH